MDFVYMKILASYGETDHIVQCACGCTFLSVCYQNGAMRNMRLVTGDERPVCPSCQRTATAEWSSTATQPTA